MLRWRGRSAVSQDSAHVGTDWRRAYRKRIAVSDSITVLFVIALAQIGSMWPHPIEWLTPLKVIASAALGGLWMIALARGRSRHQAMLGEGSDEYEKVLLATGQVFGVGALAGIILGVGIARSYLMIALPVGLAALLLGRYLWRRDIRKKRAIGDCRNSVLLVGGHASVVATTRAFVRESSAGYDVVGACIPRRATALDDHIVVDGAAVTVMGNEFEVVEAMRASGADTVIVTGTEDLGQVGIRKLMWDLEAEGVDMVVSPVVADVSKARLNVSPCGGTPVDSRCAAALPGREPACARCFRRGVLDADDPPRGAGHARRCRCSQVHVERPGVLQGGTHRPQRETVPHVQVSYHGGRRPISRLSI